MSRHSVASCAKQVPAAAVTIMSNLVCCCSIVTVACIWLFDFLPAHCLGSLSGVMTRSGLDHQGTFCGPWLLSAPARTQVPLCDVHEHFDRTGKVWAPVWSLPKSTFSGARHSFFEVRPFLKAWHFGGILRSGARLCVIGAGHRRLIHPHGRRDTFWTLLKHWQAWVHVVVLELIFRGRRNIW